MVMVLWMSCWFMAQVTIPLVAPARAYDGRMGLRGDITTQLAFTVEMWADHGRASARRVDDVMLADFAVIHAKVGEEAAGRLELRITIGDEIEYVEIGHILVEDQYQRMGCATALIVKAEEVVLGMHVHHSTNLSNDGLKWAMAVDGPDRGADWYDLNLHRVYALYDLHGKLKPGHDRHARPQLDQQPPTMSSAAPDTRVKR